MQALYAVLVAGNPPQAVADRLLMQIPTDNFDVDYFSRLFHEVTLEQVALDQHMLPHLGRPLIEMDPVELSILRVATYELCSCLDVPYRVILNEAVELGRRFGATDGHKFINGVLDKVAHEVRATEFQGMDAPSV